VSLTAPVTRADWRMLLGLWLVVFPLALCLDGPVAHWAAPHFFAMKVNLVARAVEQTGRTWFLLCVLALLAALHPRHLRAAAFVFAGSLVGAVFGAILKWAVGRTRPVADMAVDIRPFHFDFFRGGWHGLLEQRNLSFPSGHVIQVVVLAASLSLLYPRARFAWYGVALAVALERVIELAHYPSDVVAAFLVGIASFWIAAKLFHAGDWQPGASGLRAPR
jgi:membrane-associated phospholipid phosphatase